MPGTAFGRYHYWVDHSDHEPVAVPWVRMNNDDSKCLSKYGIESLTSMIFHSLIKRILDTKVIGRINPSAYQKNFWKKVQFGLYLHARRVGKLSEYQQGQLLQLDQWLASKGSSFAQEVNNS